MSCPVCRTANVVEIGLTIRETRVVMRSCSRCDSRWWDQDGVPIRLGALLELASARR